MQPSKVRNNGIAYLDDGGSAKSNHRRNQRRRRSIYETIKYPMGAGVFLIFFLTGSSVKKDTLKQRLHTNRSIISQKVGNNDDFSHYDFSENKKYRWTKRSILPPVHGSKEWAQKFMIKNRDRERPNRSDFKVAYGKKMLQWEAEAEKTEDRSPNVDYTTHEYSYPDISPQPPRGGSYPPMETLETILKRWPQNDIDEPPSPLQEQLQHFDFTDPEQLKMAKRYRNLEFPFKLTNVPELLSANSKWTDEYLSYHFDRNRKGLRNANRKEFNQQYGHIPPSDGHCQESIDSFFAFFTPRQWDVKTFGQTPTKDTDLTFAKWAKHARYADSVGLNATEPHYYWQAGASANERKITEEDWTMISVDLPSFSDLNPNFISFNPAESKGIQCRFGERGLTAATHYDGGRNMVGMITGAKRYILAPPRECRKLGIVTEKKHPTFRHSLLNFDHINILDDEESKTMPQSEREWLELSRSSMAVDTVLKAGEILYIPSHWFHYIVGLQKSAQCNVRSGRELYGSPEWGSSENVLKCVGDY
eukprot:scaffold10203_cov272-Chaetoceros_neogracile.AAC.34